MQFLKFDNNQEAVRLGVIQTLPLFEMMRMRASTTARSHKDLGYASDDKNSTLRWVNQFTHTHRRIGPEDKEVVSPNNDTAFSNAWLDLSQGPVVIESPDMGDRYWSLGFLDMWTNPFAYVGRRTTGCQAQRTLVHGPDWSGKIPDGITHTVAAPGQDMWVIGRILVDDDEEDLAAVRALQLQLSMSRLNGDEAAMRVDTFLQAHDRSIPDAGSFAAMVDFALKRNPPQDEQVHWPLVEADLEEQLQPVYSELRSTEQPQDLGGGWSLPLMVREDWGGNFLSRARVARNFIGALGVEEALYPTAQVDSEGAPLDGSKAYELTFSAENPLQVGAFWSLTVYRRSDCLLVANPLSRYSIGDRTQGLQWEADGSLRIRFQSSDPGNHLNWLPTPEDDLFYVVLRLYQPQSVHLNLEFNYPGIQRVI